MGDQAPADLVEWKAAVGIEQVGLVAVHQVLDAIEPLLLPTSQARCPASPGRPGCRRGTGRQTADRRRRRARRPAGPSCRPAWWRCNQLKLAAQMLGDAEAQAVLVGGLLPLADDVALRPHVDGVPLVELRVPAIEVVVVLGDDAEVLRAGLLVERHQPVGVPLLGLPERDDVLVAELRRMAVVRDVILVVRAALLVHLPGIPVALHRHRLRSPHRPDAQLGVAEPFGTPVLLQRFPTWAGTVRLQTHARVYRLPSRS